MKHWKMVWILAIIMMFALGAVLASGDDDSGDDDVAGCTIEDICTLAYNKCPDNNG